MVDDLGCTIRFEYTDRFFWRLVIMNEAASRGNTFRALVVNFLINLTLVKVLSSTNFKFISFLVWAPSIYLLFYLQFIINAFVTNAPFLCPWKHQKSLRFSDVFQGLEKGCIGNKWVKAIETTPKSKFCAVNPWPPMSVAFCVIWTCYCRSFS